ncbi:MAG: hypothetical protein ABEJ44_05850 [Halanaeroarchaeum sp.]
MMGVTMCHVYARTGEFEREWDRERIESSDAVDDPPEESAELERTEPSVPSADD